jgi:hypothetical protein
VSSKYPLHLQVWAKLTLAQIGQRQELYIEIQGFFIMVCSVRLGTGQASCRGQRRLHHRCCSEHLVSSDRHKGRWSLRVEESACYLLGVHWGNYHRQMKQVYPRLSDVMNDGTLSAPTRYNSISFWESDLPFPQSFSTSLLHILHTLHTLSSQTLYIPFLLLALLASLSFHYFTPKCLIPFTTPRTWTALFLLSTFPTLLVLVFSKLISTVTV